MNAENNNGPRRTEDSGGFGGLWDELKKRRVVRVGIGYLVTAWVLLQIGDVVFDALDLPDWSLKLLTLILLLGFFITLIVSWLLQVTPSGIRLDTDEGDALTGDTLHMVELAIIVVLVIAVAILSYRQFWRQPLAQPDSRVDTAQPEARSPAAGQETSIAVLPFENFSDNPADSFFGDGLAEELLHKLVRIQSLRVAARTSSFYYGRMGADIPTIAQQLQVANVLEGSVRREGDRMRVTAQLVDAEGFHLWSDIFDIDSGGVLDIQSAIALEVARRILTSISPEAQAALAERPTQFDQAYEQYLRGLEFLRGPRQPENLEPAAERFNKALELDGRFARAYAALCEVELAWFRRNRDTTHFENAERACNRALTLDAGQVEVHTALGNLYRSSNQPEKARQNFERALSLNPWFEEANYGLARSLQMLGDLDGAERLLRYSIELEPGYWATHLALGHFLHHFQRYEESVPHFEKVTELSPDNPDGYTNLGSAQYESGDWEGAERSWSTSLELRPTPMGYRNMGTLYYYQERYAEAVEMHRAALDLAPGDHRLWGRLAAAYRYLEGQAEASRAAYREAIRLARERLVVDDRDAETLANLAVYLVNTGEGSQALALAKQSVEAEPQSAANWYYSAIVKVRIGKPEEALDDLRSAVELGYSKRQLAADPQFAELRDRAGFRAMVQRGG
jgi:TolB-like protein/Flp pilus assembly protein TadD